MKYVFFVVALACSLTAGAQSKDADKTAAIKALVESGNYVFNAQTMLPIRGPVRQLTSPYDMTVRLPAKIVSNLPYYGRAYNVVDPLNGGMNFTTKDFDYTITPRKKGGWDIAIKPKDVKQDVLQLFLTITQDGYATLRATSSNRDAISYNGSVASPQ
jgi:hypothetical protein